mmetsp:Transcript_20598/g.41777  ORF Transcript_20598/g.41777 Transcript_20598/m.41777 type:complete len:104 (+) Transcript_20598:253-564(+)
MLILATVKIMGLGSENGAISSPDHSPRGCWKPTAFAPRSNKLSAAERGKDESAFFARSALNGDRAAEKEEEVVEVEVEETRTSITEQRCETSTAALEKVVSMP